MLEFIYDFADDTYQWYITAIWGDHEFTAIVFLAGYITLGIFGFILFYARFSEFPWLFRLVVIGFFAFLTLRPLFAGVSFTHCMYYAAFYFILIFSCYAVREFFIKNYAGTI